MYATSNRIGINLRQHSIRGFAITDAGKRMLLEQFGAPIIEDHLGITIFEPEPPPCFVRIYAKGIVGKSAEAFIENFDRSFKGWNSIRPKRSWRRNCTPPVILKTSASARFLALFMTLEVLMTHESPAFCFFPRLDPPVRAARHWPSLNA